MFTYIILQHPGHNRVYYDSADKLALAELRIACIRLKSECRNIRIEQIAGIRYLAFDCENELQHEDLLLISRLSFLFALFRLQETEGSKQLIPIEKINYEFVNGKISSLLKYPGKTNELFTKMMVNVALLSSQFEYDQPIQLLDPVAGRGTTLFEAAVYGFHATGIERDPKAVHEANVFFKKYIETERYKHKADKRQVDGKSKAEAVYMHWFEYARTKEEFKNDQQCRFLGYINGVAQDAANYFNNSTFNLIVGDLPYGIAHGNTAGKKSSATTRNPSELLEQCLPQWYKVLKKGGAVVVAWNSFVVSPKRLKDLFNANGFSVMDDEPYHNFEHMVDKSIKRDIIVAIKN